VPQRRRRDRYVPLAVLETGLSAVVRMVVVLVVVPVVVMVVCMGRAREGPWPGAHGGRVDSSEGLVRVA